MIQSSAAADPAAGKPASAISTPPVSATLVRCFGWCMLGVLAGYLINMLLSNAGGWPGVGSLLGDGFSVLALLQGLVYALAIVLAVLFVLRQRDLPLRRDSARISAFNGWLVRSAFFAVLFVGLGDAILSFVRIEGMLDGLVGEELGTQLGRSQYRGQFFHLPLMVLGVVVACFTRTLGFVWLTLMIVAAELLIVISRFVFSYEQAFMGDLVRFWYAALFLFASAYTLVEEGHVRVDVFYAGYARRTKGWINAFGSVFLGMTLCWTILLVGLGSRSSIIYAPIRSFETSQSGYGMYVKYLMAGFLAVFAITMLIQFVSYLMAAVADILDGDPEPAPVPTTDARDGAPQGDPSSGSEPRIDTVPAG